MRFPSKVAIVLSLDCISPATGDGERPEGAVSVAARLVCFDQSLATEGLSGVLWQFDRGLDVQVYVDAEGLEAQGRSLALCLVEDRLYFVCRTHSAAVSARAPSLTRVEFQHVGARAISAYGSR